MVARIFRMVLALPHLPAEKGHPGCPNFCMEDGLHRIVNYAFTAYNFLKLMSMVEIILSSSNVINAIETCSGTFAVAHCVSEDMQMGKGLTVSFKLKYGHIRALFDQNVGVGGIAELKIVSNQEKNVYIFYLITKNLYY